MIVCMSLLRCSMHMRLTFGFHQGDPRALTAAQLTERTRSNSLVHALQGLQSACCYVLSHTSSSQSPQPGEAHF